MIAPVARGIARPGQRRSGRPKNRDPEGMNWRDVLASSIATHLTAADQQELGLVESDIQAQKHRAEAGRLYGSRRDKIAKECEEQAISEDEWCRSHLPPSQRTKEPPSLRAMQDYMRLHKKWALYERERRQRGIDGPWGLGGALEIIGSATERSNAARHTGIGKKIVTEANYDPAIDNYHMPRRWFDPLHERLKFTIDLAASDTAHLVPRYFTAGQNALKHPWRDERGFLNPPWVHRGIRKWLEYALTQEFELLLCVLPAEINSRWFHELVLPRASALLVPDRRLPFDGANHAPWSVMFVLYAERAPWAVDALADVPGCRLVRLSNHVAQLPPSAPAIITPTAPHLITPRHPAIITLPKPAIVTSSSMPPLDRPHGWRSPELVWRLLARRYPRGYTDVCPNPLPDGYDALGMERWVEDGPLIVYCNPPYVPKDERFGRNRMAWVMKAIQQRDDYGIEVAMLLPIYDYVGRLLQAGATIEPLGRQKFLDPYTGKPASSPPSVALFTLRPHSC